VRAVLSVGNGFFVCNKLYCKHPQKFKVISFFFTLSVAAKEE
jgi:hypothetical protein